MHFYEVLKESIQDYEYERLQIEELFSKSSWPNAIRFLNMPANETLESFLEEEFRQSRLRGSAASFKTFFEAHARHWKQPSLEGLLYYSEMMLNILNDLRETIQSNREAASRARQISDNIQGILERSNHRQIRTADNFIAIVPEDATIVMAIEDTTDQEPAQAVLEYTYCGLKGNIGKKRSLLRKIGQYIEPILQDAEMKGTYGWLTKDLGCCLNSLHIRHNNKEGDKANAVVQAMSDGELEECYDNTYREMLLLIELQRNLPFHRKVEGLREQLGGKKGGSAG